VVRPAGQRSLAGFTLGEHLARQVYGDLYRATGDGRRDARLLIVDPALVAEPAFAEALSSGTAALLGAFQHRAVVGTLVVARDGKDLVIVTEAVRGGKSLEDLVAGGRPLPPRIAAAIARSVIDGIATAHAAGITHGAIHPRSVVVDDDGAVRVTDFAVGHAAMMAAAAGSTAVSLRGLGGYLAPEIALGDPPTPGGDVYALGALVFSLLSGTTPPGTLNTTPAVERLVQRALDTDLHRRFATAIELQENFIEALEDDRWDSASPAEVARALAELSPPAVSGDDGIEDLLASLSGAVEVTKPTAAGAASPAVAAPIAAPASGLPGLAGLPGLSGLPGRGKRGTGALDAVLDDLDDASDDAHTVVEDPRGQAGRDPISELIALTPSPTPPPSEPEARPRRAPLLAPEPTGEIVAPAPSPAVEVAVAPAPASSASSAAAVTPRRAPPLVELPPEVDPPTLGRGKTWVSIVAGLVFVVGGYFLVTGLLDQGKERSAKERAAEKAKLERDKKRAELEQALADRKAKSGKVRITSSPDLAAVWLLLGRGPFESVSISTANVWELRVELEGYQTQDLHVVGSQWTGAKEALSATVEVKLTPATATSPKPPAMPKAPAATETGGPVDGRGRLKVVTDPPGAAVYLLVGQTNRMEFDGLEAGRDYEFKLTRDGSLPGFVRIAAEDWREPTDPNLPGAVAKLRTSIDRAVELTPAPPVKGAGGR
jgi:serine/threonine protein kinase